MCVFEIKRACVCVCSCARAQICKLAQMYNSDQHIGVHACVCTRAHVRTCIFFFVCVCARARARVRVCAYILASLYVRAMTVISHLRIDYVCVG